MHLCKCPCDGKEGWTRHNCIEADQLCGNKTLEWNESPYEEPKPVPCTEGCPCELCEDVLKRNIEVVVVTQGVNVSA